MTPECHLEEHDASVPVPEVSTPISASDALASMSDADRGEWRKTGALPANFAVQSAESAPAEPVAQAASTDASPEPASEPAAKPKKNADTRVNELLADRAAERQRAERAERELQELRTKSAPDAKPAAPSPAPTVDEFPKYADWLETHPGQDYEVYLDARSDYRDGQREQKASERRALDDMFRQAHARVAEVAKVDPTFSKSISEDVANLKTAEEITLRGEVPTPLNVLASHVMSSEVTPTLMRFFSEHPEEMKRLVSIPKPWDFIREFGKLEGRLSSAPAKAAPEPKTQTDAPPPGTTLGSRPGVPGDPVLSAIRAGDAKAYRDAMNARELAAKG